MTLPLPQFYSLVAAVKTVPRISLKDAPAAPTIGSGTAVPRAPGSTDSADAWGAHGGVSNGASSCFFRGLVSMIWGYDTSDDEEIPRRKSQVVAPSKLGMTSEPTTGYPAPKSSRSSDLDTQRSADWLLAVSRQEERGENAQGSQSSSSSAENSPSRRKEGNTGISINSGVPINESNFNSLDHAISLPAQTPPKAAQVLQSQPQQRNPKEESESSTADNRDPALNSWWSWFN